MPTVVRAAFGDVLLAVRTELAEFLEWHASRILIVAGDRDVPYRTGDQDVLLRSRRESPERGAIDGGGRVVNRRTRTFDVEMRTRMVLDPADQDLQRLTTDSTGHLALEDMVCDCLECFFPLDGDGNSLVCAPLRCQGLSDAEQDRDSPVWVTSTWTVEVLYDRALTLTRGV